MTENQKRLFWPLVALAFVSGAVADMFYMQRHEVKLVAYTYANGETIRLPDGLQPADVARLAEKHKGETPVRGN